MSSAPGGRSPSGRIPRCRRRRPRLRVSRGRRCTRRSRDPWCRRRRGRRRLRRPKFCIIRGRENRVTYARSRNREAEAGGAGVAEGLGVSAAVGGGHVRGVRDVRDLEVGDGHLMVVREKPNLAAGVALEIVGHGRLVALALADVIDGVVVEGVRGLVEHAGFLALHDERELAGLELGRGLVGVLELVLLVAGRVAGAGVREVRVALGVSVPNSFVA